MSRRVVLLLVLAIVVVVGAAGVLVVTARPSLEDRRDAVDARWASLRDPLATRYDGLRQVGDALATAGAGERTYAVELAGALDEWAAFARDPDPAAEATIANQLEGVAARVRANVAASARLGRDPTIAAAFGAFDRALVPPPAVRAYNRAVRRYQDARTDTLKQVPADLLGYDPRPILVIGAPPPQ